MSKGKKFIIAVAVLLAVALVSGLTALAVTNYGTESDPLVTLSYLNETLTPAIIDEVQSNIDSKAAELETKFNDAIAGVGSGGTTAPSDFIVLTLSKGQTVTCSVGTEIMLRIGTAAAAGDNSPRLIDETTGQSVSSSGSALTVNHMYMVTIKDNGITATSGTVKILIRGEYTVK